MDWEFSDGDIMMRLLIAFFVFGLGVIVGANMRGGVIERDSIRNGVGCYSVNRDTGQVKFYWLTSGTNVEA